MSWTIKPLQQTDSGRWRMTAMNLGLRSSTHGISAAEIDGFFANDDHDHASEFECWRCERCKAWGHLNQAGSGDQGNSASEIASPVASGALPNRLAFDSLGEPTK